jgi:hypothetical protein
MVRTRGHKSEQKYWKQGGDQRNVNQEVVNQVDVNQLNSTQRKQFLLINQFNFITELSWLR